MHASYRTEDGREWRVNYPVRWSRPHWRILCYHEVAESLVDAFRAQLTAFREMGFSFIEFDEGVKRCLGEGFRKPMMTVTFDDGYKTVYENALPILEELGIKGFQYLVVDYIDKGRNYRQQRPSPTMSWDDVRDWLRRGHGVGSHTFSHAPLNRCSASQLIHECALSKNVLEEKLHVPIRHLAYPLGYHSRRTYILIKQSQLYDSVATIDRGRVRIGHDPYRLRRDVCDPGCPVRALVRVMRLADTWYFLRYPRRHWQRYLYQRRLARA